MAAKKKSLLAQRVDELEDAVARLFSGAGPAPKTAKRKTAAQGRKVKKTAAKAKRKAKRKARR